MKRLLTLLMLLTFSIFLTSCGAPFGKDLKRANRGEIRQFSTTNPEFNDFITQFEKNGETYTGKSNFVRGDVPINFGDTEDPKYDGVCIIYSNGQREILIKQSWWKMAETIQKKLLVYHELGHCTLDRDHDETTIEIDGKIFKLSIMNPIIPLSSSFEDNDRQVGYLDELFNKTKTKITAAYNTLSNKDRS